MNAAVVFVNNLENPISELHGIMKFYSTMENVEFAKTTINFDANFMGEVFVDEAILVHFNIPVKGMKSNMEFKTNDLKCVFEEVRVTYVEEK